VSLVDAPLTVREFMMQEPLPLATIFHEVLSFVAKREDAVVFGAHAVNVYCEPPRMTADVDLLSTDGLGLANDLRAWLSDKFHIAARVREVVDGGFRVYQLRKPKNRHLVDVRQVAVLPAFRQIEGIRVVEPAELVALKAMAVAGRKGHEKALSDRLDLHRLLRTFPELRAEDGLVPLRLSTLGGSGDALRAWQEVARQPLESDDDELDNDD
jgi:hypothetical protein